MTDVRLSNAGHLYSDAWDNCGMGQIGWGPCTAVDMSTHNRSAIWSIPFEISPAETHHWKRIQRAQPAQNEYIYIHPIVDLYKEIHSLKAQILQPVEGLVFELEMYSVAENCPQYSPIDGVKELGASYITDVTSLGVIDMNPIEDAECTDQFPLFLKPGDAGTYAGTFKTMGMRLKVVSPPTNGWSTEDPCMPTAECWGLALRFMVCDYCFADQEPGNWDCRRCYDPRAHFGRPPVFGF